MPKDVNAIVAYNTQVSKNYFRLGLATGWRRFDPGQFVMVRVPDNAVFIRRPFGISRAADDNGIELLYKVVGPGTRRISRLEENEKVKVLGPLGKGFVVHKSLKRAMIVAGGFGIAPFVGMIETLSKENIPTTLYYGGKGLEDILFLDEFEEKGVTCQISTEDGSLGHHGMITELLLKDIANLLKIGQRSKAKGQRLRIRGAVLYCCGPKGLSEAVIAIARKYGIPAQISFDAYMGCGIGVCLGCAVKTKDGYKRACREGPVFHIDDLQAQ